MSTTKELIEEQVKLVHPEFVRNVPFDYPGDARFEVRVYGTKVRLTLKPK